MTPREKILTEALTRLSTAAVQGNGEILGKRLSQDPFGREILARMKVAEDALEEAQKVPDVVEDILQFVQTQLANTDALPALPMQSDAAHKIRQHILSLVERTHEPDRYREAMKILDDMRKGRKITWIYWGDDLKRVMSAADEAYKLLEGEEPSTT